MYFLFDVEYDICISTIYYLLSIDESKICFVGSSDGVKCIKKMDTIDID